MIALFVQLLCLLLAVDSFKIRHSTPTIPSTFTTKDALPKFVKSLVSSTFLPLIFFTGAPLESIASVEGETSIFSTSVVFAESQKENVQAYFGVGCFWHVQHEFVQTERKLLGRADDELTSFAGYAGGTKYGTVKLASGEQNDKAVCYHNFGTLADYGSLGHGEVVGMSMPESSLAGFADEYFSLFGADNERPDKGDRGSEYRSLIGVPGGVRGKYFATIDAAAKKKGLKLLEGKGDDADTLGKKIVWVMDSNAFPFNPAEIYHQYHDGFMPGEQYPEAYNALVQTAKERGAVKSTGCPERFLL